jgi:ankyrin repeat protein
LSRGCCETRVSIRLPGTTLRFVPRLMNGHRFVVERLLRDERVDPSAQDNLAIQFAAENGHLAIVERLLADKRVDPSAQDNEVLRRAIANGHDAVVALLKKDKRVKALAPHNNNRKNRRTMACAKTHRATRAH